MSATGDMKLVWSGSELAADVTIDLNDLGVEDGLRTAVALSLFLDRRAEYGDILPDGEPDRRGWWADELLDVGGDRIGSRLWQLEREKLSSEVLSRAEQYAVEALQWLVDDHVSERVRATASVPRTGWLSMTIEIDRPHQKEPTRFRFESVWQAEES